MKKQNVQYAPRSRSHSRLKTVSALAASHGGDPGAVVAPDHEVGALALADLVGDDRLDELGVLLVVALEAAAVEELEAVVGDRREGLLEREVVLDVDVDHDEGGAVVVGLEAALGDLPERDRQQAVGGASVFGRAVLEGYVEQARDLAPRTADREHGVVVAHPHQRPRVVPLQRGEHGRRGRVRGHARQPTNGGARPPARLGA